MKKIFALTTSLCAAACAIGLGGASAFADFDLGQSGIDFYPEDFTKTLTFETLEDYAVSEDSAVFLQNNRIIKYSGERLETLTNGKEEITNVYYDGVFRYGTRGGKIYNLDDIEKDETEKDGEENYADPTKRDNIELNGFLYYRGGSKIYALDKNAEVQNPVLLDGFSNLKQFGQTAYAVKDNVLYTLNGDKTQAAEIKYSDFSAANNILIGNASISLKTYNSTGPVFVSLAENEMLTQVDISALSGEVFITGETYIVGKDFESTSALLLGKTGADDGISIVSVDKTCYILRTEHARPNTARNPLSASEFTNATTIFKTYVCSSPFENESTRIKELESGTELKILNEVKETDNPELRYNFYQVEYEYTDGDKTEKVTGYVPMGAVTPRTFHETPPVSTPDPDETYDDLVKPVVLVLVVLLLAVIAIGYLIYIGTSGKRKHRKIKDKTDSGENKR